MSFQAFSRVVWRLPTKAFRVRKIRSSAFFARGLRQTGFSLKQKVARAKSLPRFCKWIFRLHASPIEYLETPSPRAASFRKDRLRNFLKWMLRELRIPIPCARRRLFHFLFNTR